jgi:RHS repeat-associated protein
MNQIIKKAGLTLGFLSATAYAYKLNGALDEETYPSTRVVKNQLDSNGDLSAVESKKTLSAGFWRYADTFTYSAAGAVTSMQLGNGLWEKTVFNSRLQPTQIGLGTTTGTTGLLRLDYSYGTTQNNGNVQTQTITVPTVGSVNGFSAFQTYNYDSLNRLKDATEMSTPNGGSASQSWKQEFSYDRYGNRNFVTGSGHTDTLGSCTTMCNPSFDTSNNRINSTGYSFDSAGNTTADPSGQSFTYDGENKQVLVTNGSGTVGQYFYDGDGKRVKKYVPATGETTVFVYDAAGKEIAEYSTIVANSTDAKVNYLTADHLGSPRINTDQNGAVIARHDYMPFGEEIGNIGGRNTSDDSVRKQFTGYERDIESELDFAQNRYYQSKHGRFTTTDPLLTSGRLVDPQSWNRYAYVLNSPLRYVDPLGLYECGTSVTEKQCQKFEQARLDLEKARDHYQKKGDTTKADALSNALKAIGTLNDKNGLTIEIGKVAKGAAAETSFGTGADGKPLLAKDADGKGNYVANVVMTFKSSDDMTAEVLSHEGSHTEDRQKFIAAMFAASAKDPLFSDEMAKSLPENLTKYVTESKAYHNSSYVQEYKGVEGEYWKRGWAEVDRQKAINNTLRTSDLYKVTPEKPGLRLYETIPKK